MELRYINVATPLGDFGMLLEERRGVEVVVVSGFTQLDGLRKMLVEEAELNIRQVTEGHPYAVMVARYFEGDMRALDSIPSDQPGGGFFRKVWQEMSRIQPGKPLTYAQLATKAGSPKAVRAAGSACSRNRVALLVPCHRVIPSSGKKSGNYLYGSETKQYLLAHEARHGA